MSEVDILRYGVYALSAIATGIGGALIAVVVWNAKAVISSIGELRGDIKLFDRRITRLEAKSSWRLYGSERQSGAD